MRARSRASIAVAVAVVVACGESRRPDDVVVYASGSDLESANPLVTIHPLSRQVQRHALFVTLVRYDSTLTPQPYYAADWSWSADRRTLRMNLQPDVRWHDGPLTTSRDVAFTLLAARDPRSGFARASDLAAIDTVVAETDRSLRVVFRVPQRDLPQLFAELPILPEHKLASIAFADMRRADFNTRPVGNGPFRFIDRVAGQRWTFARNDAFPLAMGGPPKARELVIAVVDEPTTKFAGLASGDLDFAGIAPTMAALAKRDPSIDVVDYPILFSTALVFNAQRAPFNDARVRRAINASIDRRRIVDAALAGYGTPAAGPVAPANPLALAGDIEPDPRLADSLLDAAGYSRDANGHRAISAELLTVATGDNPIEQLIQADLAARGIRLGIRQVELAAFLARARAREKSFDVLITGIPGDLSLAYLRAMFESSQRGGSLDYADFHTPQLDALFARAANARDDAQLRAAWWAVQEQLAHDVPVVWIYHARGLQGMSARMRHVRMDLRGELATVANWTRDGARRRDSAGTVARR